MDAMPAIVDPVVARITDPGPAGRILRHKIQRACAKAGDPLTVQAIFAWRKLKSGVPPRRVETIARLLHISSSEIRPDIFPPERAYRAAPVRKRTVRKKKKRKVTA